MKVHTLRVNVTYTVEVVADCTMEAEQEAIGLVRQTNQEPTAITAKSLGWRNEDDYDQDQ